MSKSERSTLACMLGRNNVALIGRNMDIGRLKIIPKCFWSLPLRNKRPRCLHHHLTARLLSSISDDNREVPTDEAAVAAVVDAAGVTGAVEDDSTTAAVAAMAVKGENTCMI